ncbi:MAG: DNA mismatch repair endonuclease MutL [Chloroflexota bacterium]|nr:DNA mismatch repair endonuclease MutL [Chloroflexota bacterium]
MPIRVLPHEVAARIAAGEVVERPASAVKELVENSLDAGSTAVRVEVHAGGLGGVRVVDNGGGIPAADVANLFQRHATSKLTAAEDLQSIETLGFRGEALYSLAAVARVSILTRTPESNAATYVEAANGRIQRQEPRGGPVGATVSVEELFEQLPARKKFLRSARSEQSRVHGVITNYALAYPDVRFTLVADGRTAFASPGEGGLREAASAVFGREAAQAFLAVDAPAGASAIGVAGLVSPPESTRANRSGITLFVNRRPVQHRSLTYAVTEAYHGLLPSDRFPIAVLLLDVPPEDVDVNVHPTKAEVRFRREGDVFAALQRAVRETVIAVAPVPEIEWGAVAQPPTGGLGPVTVTPRVPEFAPPMPDGAPRSPDAGVTQPQFGLPGMPDDGAPARVVLARDDTPGATPPPSHEQAPMTMMQALPALRVLGQTQETYIVAEGPDGLYLIDQHAAHECVVYERLRLAAQRGAPDVQGLLEPAAVALSPAHEETVHDNPDVLAHYGWLLEPFGGRTTLLRGVPAVLAGRDPAKAFLDMLEQAAAAAEFSTWEDRISATVACHGSVRAGQTLSREEMVELVRLLERTQQPHTCPHGRPTMLHLSAGNLEREFGRR